MFRLLFRLVSLLVFAISAHAVEIPIVNASFEDPVFPPEQTKPWTNSLHGWTVQGPAENAFIEYISGFSADGRNHLGMYENTYVYQDLGAVYKADAVYTLTVAVGRRPGVTQTNNTSFYDLANGEDQVGNLVVTQSVNAGELPSGTFADGPPLVLDTALRPEVVGKVIRIGLFGMRGRSHYDHVRLVEQVRGAEGTAKLSGLSTDPLARSATISGSVVDPGDSEPSLTLFYGSANGGFEPSAWEHSIDFTATAGSFAVPISSLERASVYHAVVRATNSAGVSWSEATSFETQLELPEVVTLSASDVTPRQASVGAQVTDTGGETPEVILFYGPTDGGEVSGAWAQQVSLGSVADQGASELTGLQHSTTYYVRAFAQNSQGGAWADNSIQFTTAMVQAPVVINRSAKGVTGVSAELRGRVTDDGGDPPTVTIFYGEADGGTDETAWADSVPLSALTGDFSGFVSGLLPQTSYFFRSRAVNAAGTAWAPETASFATGYVVPNDAIINEFHYNPSGQISLEEFIELHNPGDTPLDLSGWQLRDAVSFTFPVGTTLPARGHVVVGENPDVLLQKYGVTALGPWSGKLNSRGERIDLVDQHGIRRDRVDYGVGYPWPTGADGGGSSVELVHPSLDRNSPGSWRSSGMLAAQPTVFFAAATNGWKYKKGTEEASMPVDAWRLAAFDDSSWLRGPTPIGYNDSNGHQGIATVLSDMRDNYKSVYLKNSFTIIAGDMPNTLRLRTRVDDGCVIWINGHEVARLNVGPGHIPYNGDASNRESNTWDEITLENADQFLVGGTNTIAVHVINVTTESSDLFFDLELTDDLEESSVPTPGARNSAHRGFESIPPQVGEVVHSPQQPKSEDEVLVTTRITDPDGVAQVTLEYQLVDPGAYIRADAESYQTNWTPLPMVDDGSQGDLVAGDSIYSVTLPASMQEHRRLVRYRIKASDTLGNSVTVPYEDDEQPNFAYFVYDGVPSWTGALRPTAGAFPSTPMETFPSEVLESITPFHLIADGSDVSRSQYNGTFEYTKFWGTVVERGKVYDHIQFRVRGQGSTYQSGKNKWNVYFNRARDYQGYDNYGRPYRETWNNLLINANASPWAPVHRGSAGIEEASSNRIYQLAGMAAMNTQYMHLRVIDSVVETSTTSQYEGDLWGLYLGLEPTEGNFLDERDLPDGNLYSIEGGPNKKRQGPPPAAVDNSDWDTFNNQANQAGQTAQWYRDHVDLEALYTFLAINRLIGNVDVRIYNNYRFYHRPTDGRWVIIPYDLDMMYIAAHHWGGWVDGVTAVGAPSIVRAISRHPELALEYRNRCRELLSLLASDGTPGGGQIGQLIDEYARFVAPEGTTLNWANLDAAMWNMHPRTSGSVGSNNGQGNHKGNFFRAEFEDSRGGNGGSVPSIWVRTLDDPDEDGFADFETLKQWFVNYATNTWPGGEWSRKALVGIGDGKDLDPNRQLGFGYKYLEFESLYGGWINGRANPTAPPDLDFPAKPEISYLGSAGHPVDDLQFVSSDFVDPQGPETHAASQWRIAEIQGPGIAGWQVGTPRKYEIEGTWDSGEVGITSAYTIPFGIAEAGKTYRVRVRHKDDTGRWSYWSDPVEFVAGEPAPSVLLHYWNFNSSSDFLSPTHTAGGGALSFTADSGSTVIRHTSTDQGFVGLNARNGDPVGGHLRVNYPIGVTLTFALPTTGHQDIVIAYETRRSGSGAGLQEISYTVNGIDYQPFAERVIASAAPVVETLDFRAITEVDDNPNFGIRITFAQGDGDLGGNNRFDNVTVESSPLPGDPLLIPGGDADWNQAANWTSASVPDGISAKAIIGPAEGANRAVTITSPVSLGKLTIGNGSGEFRNRINGVGLIFEHAESDALLHVTGDGPGFAELEIAGGVTLHSDLELRVDQHPGDVDHGALRLREAWSGTGGIKKTGIGMAALTGGSKDFTGPLRIEFGALKVTESSVPGASSGVSVLSGGQLRLISQNVIGVPRVYTFGGGTIEIAGMGRGGGLPTSEHLGLLGAIRMDPESDDNHSILTNPILLNADADAHVDRTSNRLEWSGMVSGGHVLSKTGGGTLELSGASPLGAPSLLIENGRIDVSGTYYADVIASEDGVLSGTGTVGAVSGQGVVRLTSGVLTAPSSAISRYEFGLGAGGFATLHLTDAPGLLAGPQTIDIYLEELLAPGGRVQGGFLTGTAVDLDAALALATVRLWIADSAGSSLWAGNAYRAATLEDELVLSVVVNQSGKTLELGRGGGGPSYAQWQSAMFTDPNELSDPAISGPYAAPFGDGIANIMRYAHGVGRAEEVRALLPRLDGAGGFQFRFDPSFSDVIWVVRSSTDLVDWSAVQFDSRTDPAPAVDGSGWASLPISGTGAVQFFRLELILSADP